MRLSVVVFMLLISTLTSAQNSFFVRAITLDGNVKTKDQILYRELPILPGTRYDSVVLFDSLLIQAKYNLTNLNLFNHIIFHKSVSQDTFSLRIEVTEKWYFWPFPFVEYADRNFNQWYSFDFDPDRTNVGFNIQKYNLWGLDHTIILEYSQGYTNRKRFVYDMPFQINTSLYHAQVEASHSTNREIWYQTIDNTLQFFRHGNRDMIRQSEVYASIAHRPIQTLRHRINWKSQYTWIDDTITSQELNPMFLVGGATSQMMHSLYYDVTSNKTNVSFMPTMGYSVSAQVGLDHLAPSKTTYIRALIEASTYGKIPYLTHINKLRAAAGFKAQYLSDASLPYQQRRALGYDHLVRGNERFVADGPNFAMLQFDLRYMLLDDGIIPLRWMPIKLYKKVQTTSFVNIFGDVGTTRNTLLAGYGIGLNTIIYYDKVVRFEYSWDRFGTGGLKLHFKKAF